MNNPEEKIIQNIVNKCVANIFTELKFSGIHPDEQIAASLHIAAEICSLIIFNHHLKSKVPDKNLGDSMRNFVRVLGTTIPQSSC